jgi:hypothetical protein
VVIGTAGLLLEVKVGNNDDDGEAVVDIVAPITMSSESEEDRDSENDADACKLE